KPPSFKVKNPPLVLRGTCPMPDGVVLSVTLSRLAEQLLGTLLEPTFLGAGGGNVEIEGKKFEYEAPIAGPAKYLASVKLDVEQQDKQHVPEVKKRTTGKQLWQFEFLVW